MCLQSKLFYPSFASQDFAVNRRSFYTNKNKKLPDSDQVRISCVVEGRREVDWPPTDREPLAVEMQRSVSPLHRHKE